MVTYRWIQCNTIINPIVGKDKLFKGRYALDPYQKCDLSCIYCDASEETVFIKYNAPEILPQELNGLERGTVIVGSTSDPYQMIEAEQCLTKRILDILTENGFPFHILTKSAMVLRDISLITKGNSTVTVSFSTLDEELRRIVEPHASSINDRIETLKVLSEKGVTAGVALMPVIPILSEMHLEDCIEKFSKAGARYLIYETLELKGDVRRRFLDVIRMHYPDIATRIEKLYKNSYKPKGYDIDKKIKKYCRMYNLR
ncbi:MAG TPA: radical SAM protein, partial [Thermoplasmatales archaeon]|nr:radical SAM protein [Thermoplasmatales archaeon]